MEVMQEQYKDTKIGRIPKDWEVMKFGDVFNFIKTSSHSKNEMVYSETDSEIYNVHYGAIHTTYKEQILDFKKYNVPRITDDSKMPREDQFLKDGDLVIVDASEDWGGMGECVELNNLDGRKVIGGLHTYAVRDRRNLFAKGFTGYIFQNTAVRNKLASYANVSKVYGITKGNISNVSLVIPTLPEQKKIAAILSTVDEQISTTDKIIEKSKELKRGLMQKLFSEGIGHTEFKDTKIGRIPKDWEVVKIANIGTVIDSLHQTPKFSDEGYPMVRVGDINKTKLNLNHCLTVPENVFKAFTKKHLPIKGDILITRVGSFGKTILVENDSPFCLGQNTAVITDLKNERFVYYMLNSHPVLKQIGILTNGSTQPSLSLKEIRNIKIAVGSNNEQQKIVEILSEADAKIEEEQTKKAHLEALKKGLMQQLLTGKKRVKV